MPVRQISDGNPDGNVLGGRRAISRFLITQPQTPSAQARRKRPYQQQHPQNVTPYGYSQAQATAIITLLNKIGRRSSGSAS